MMATTNHTTALQLRLWPHDDLEIRFRMRDGVPAARNKTAKVCFRCTAAVLPVELQQHSKKQPNTTHKLDSWPHDLRHNTAYEQGSILRAGNPIARNAASLPPPPAEVCYAATSQHFVLPSRSDDFNIVFGLIVAGARPRREKAATMLLLLPAQLLVLHEDKQPLLSPNFACVQI